MTHSYVLVHHGVKGQSWGNRQYQNQDGSLTALGREHYGYGQGSRRKARLEYKTSVKKAKEEWLNAAKKYGAKSDDKSNKKYEDAADKYNASIKKLKKKELLAVVTKPLTKRNK